jgi:hypothetical protein
VVLASCGVFKSPVRVSVSAESTVQDIEPELDMSNSRTSILYSRAGTFGAPESSTRSLNAPYWLASCIKDISTDVLRFQSPLIERSLQKKLQITFVHSSISRTGFRGDQAERIRVFLHRFSIPWMQGVGLQLNTNKATMSLSRRASNGGENAVSVESVSQLKSRAWPLQSGGEYELCG